MKLLLLLLLLTTLPPPLTTATIITYDENYDNRTLPLTSIACSDGPNGLITRYGWLTQGSIPRSPPHPP